VTQDDQVGGWEAVGFCCCCCGQGRKEEEEEEEVESSLPSGGCHSVDSDTSLV
jgi:hypothetical protein